MDLVRLILLTNVQWKLAMTNRALGYSEFFIERTMKLGYNESWYKQPSNNKDNNKVPNDTLIQSDELKWKKAIGNVIK